MKIQALICILVSATAVYIVTLKSNKTTGKVPDYPEVNFPVFTQSSQIIEEQTSLQSLLDLSLPRLVALDPETETFIKTFIVEDPEQTADWALSIDNDFARDKVLIYVLRTWTSISPRTCADWVERLPLFDKTLDLYITVARSWAANAPNAAIEEYRKIDENEKAKYGEFVVPLTKVILQVWAAKSPELAAAWVTQAIISDNERQALYPIVMDVWFENAYVDVDSGQLSRFFDWLSQLKYDEQADLDSLFFMKQWVLKDSVTPFEWISKQPRNDYISKLVDVAAATLAEKDLKTCEMYIKNSVFSSLENNFRAAFISRFVGTNDQQALAALNDISDLKLFDSIATKSAMQLVAANDEDAMLYVKATGFLTFPYLEDYFLLWAQGDPQKVLDWLKNNSYSEFVSAYLVRVVKEWNMDPHNPPVSTAVQTRALDHLTQGAQLIDKENSVDALPPEVMNRLRQNIPLWNLARAGIVEEIAAVWAEKNFAEALSFALNDKSPVFSTFCLRGILPQTPPQSFDETREKLLLLDEEYPHDKLFYALALSNAKQSPAAALDLVKKKGLIDSQFIMQTIDLSIKNHHDELIKALDEMSLDNIHIYSSYFFYQLTRFSPANSSDTLKKYVQKPWYSSALKAIAASYKDYHQSIAEEWSKNLNGKEREIVSKVLY